MKKLLIKILILSFALSGLAVVPSTSFAHGYRYRVNHYHVVGVAAYNPIYAAARRPAYLTKWRRQYTTLYNYNGYRHRHGTTWDGCGHALGSPIVKNYTFYRWNWGYYSRCTIKNPWRS